MTNLRAWYTPLFTSHNMTHISKASVNGTTLGAIDEVGGGGQVVHSHLIVQGCTRQWFWDLDWNEFSYRYVAADKPWDECQFVAGSIRDMCALPTGTLSVIHKKFWLNVMQEMINLCNIHCISSVKCWLLINTRWNHTCVQNKYQVSNKRWTSREGMFWCPHSVILAHICLLSGILPPPHLVSPHASAMLAKYKQAYNVALKLQAAEVAEKSSKEAAVRQ